MTCARLPSGERADLSQDPAVVREYAAKIREVEHRQAAALIQAAAEKKDSLGVLRLWQDVRASMERQLARTIYPVVEHARLRVAQAERLRVRPRGQVTGTGSRPSGRTSGAIRWSRWRRPGSPALLGHSIVEQLNQALSQKDDRAILAAVADAEAAAVPIGPDARQARRAAQRRESTRSTLAAAQRDGDDAAIAELASDRDDLTNSAGLIRPRAGPPSAPCIAQRWQVPSKATTTG